MTSTTGEGTLIAPVPADLSREEVGQIVVGPQTQIACDEAVRLHKERPGSRIFLSATEAPDFDRVVMWRVMEQYIRSQYPLAKFAHWESTKFRTRGDVLALVQYIHFLRSSGQCRVKVLFAVKHYHERRLRYLVDKLFRHNGIDDIERVYVPHDVYLSDPEYVQALDHERKAMFKERVLSFFGVY